MPGPPGSFCNPINESSNIDPTTGKPCDPNVLGPPGSYCNPLPASADMNMGGSPYTDRVRVRAMGGSSPYNTDTVLIPPPVGVKPEATTGTYNCPAPPPCPACDRCPEPSFDCKKVPNYNSTDNQRILPQAVLTDFSSFGM
jgi:hypothetical protein